MGGQRWSDASCPGNETERHRLASANMRAQTWLQATGDGQQSVEAAGRTKKWRAGRKVHVVAAFVSFEARCQNRMWLGERPVHRLHPSGSSQLAATHCTAQHRRTVHRQRLSQHAGLTTTSPE